MLEGLPSKHTDPEEDSAPLTRSELRLHLQEKIDQLVGARVEGQNEKLDLREKLDSALTKLPELINALPIDSRERARAEHTLRSVQGALENLGKEGAPSGTYAVAVEGYEGNPQPPYTQYEGVPVDELINVLRDSAKELNKDFPTSQKLAELKKMVRDLDEEYERATEATEKARKYSELEEAKKAYRKMEEELDLGPSKETKELNELANELYKGSKGYFEAHYTSVHGEGGEWTQEEKDRQDLRTRHEAKLISMDYRATGSEEGDYKAAMEVFKYRRELQLAEKAEENKEPVAPAEPATPLVEPPVAPEPIPAPPKKEKKENRGPRKVALVDAEAQVELHARKRGSELLNQKLNHEGWLKKKWVQTWEQGYRQQFINEERKKILGQENRPGFIRKALFGARGFEATGKKNLFAGTAREAEHNPEMESLATRFAEDLHRTVEGETKNQIENPQFSERVNDLVYQFAVGTMSEAEFEVQKDALVGEISAEYSEFFAEGGLTADNVLEAARDFRNIYEHSGALARVDVNLAVDLGVAKQAIKTEANLNWVDKVAGKAQKYLGPVASPEAIGFGVSIGSYFARKPVYWLGGAAGMGGLLGAMRRNVEQKNDLAMHRIERAMGAGASGADTPRREAAERFVYEMRAASDISAEVRKLSEDFDAAPTPETADALVKVLADAEARQSLSESRQGDLISFSGETNLERGRLDFMRTLAEAKVALREKGFESNIEGTDAYQEAFATLGGEMDKIDNSEKWHRWRQNGKAAVVGAVMGTAVGGLAQEAFAVVGDTVSALHWLRLGGKATSIESLVHYWNGDVPTAPTGAGVFEVRGLPASGVIKIDGTTELIPDPTTGLMALVDKADHSQILAKVNIDAAGRVTPVPGSYDPNLINFSESRVAGGAKPLDQWIASMKGKFGANVAEDTWHTKGYLDNNTPLPKVEFNELKLFMQYDAGGNLTIDASKLQEYMQNSAGDQTQGSKSGSSVLDVAGEFAKGTIKIGLAPDAARPTAVFELTYDAGSRTFVAPNGAPIQSFFEADAKGRPVLKGNGVLGIVHELGARPDGSKNVEWVNAIRGNGQPIETGDSDRLVTEINRKTPVGWWGPWLWSFGRKPLEERKEEAKGQNEGGAEDKKKDEFVDTKGKPLGFKPEDFEGPGIGKGDRKKRIEGGKGLKKTVATRGQKIEKIDAKDFEEGYPEQFPFLNEREIAERLISQDTLFMRRKDQERYISLDPAARVDFLEERIKKDREFLEITEGRGLNKEGMQAIVDVVLKATSKVFGEYSPEGHSQLPAKEKIHIVGSLEYQAQVARFMPEPTMGVRFTHSGEIFINFDLLRNIFLEVGSIDEDAFIAQLKRIIAHEVTHDTAANNYWMFGLGSGEEVPLSRRAGILLQRSQTISGGQQIILERGRALNEAITEELAKRVKDEIYRAEGGPAPASVIEPYPAERNVLGMLSETLGIPFEVFAKAAINRRALRQLAEALDGRNSDILASESTESRERPQFMSLFLSIMDHEFATERFTYDATKRLIQGQKGIVITKEMKKKFAPGLLDRTGSIKQSLIDRYGLVDEEKAIRAPVAA